MRRKSRAQTESGIAPEILTPEILKGVKRSAAIAGLKPAPRCIVCAGETTPGGAEQLCWVCRRLKISAWRDVEQQMPAQE